MSTTSEALHLVTCCVLAKRSEGLRFLEGTVLLLLASLPRHLYDQKVVQRAYQSAVSRVDLSGVF